MYSQYRLENTRMKNVTRLVSYNSWLKLGRDTYGEVTEVLKKSSSPHSPSTGLLPAYHGSSKTISFLYSNLITLWPTFLNNSPFLCTILNKPHAQKYLKRKENLIKYMLKTSFCWECRTARFIDFEICFWKSVGSTFRTKVDCWAFVYNVCDVIEWFLNFLPLFFGLSTIWSANFAVSSFVNALICIAHILIVEFFDFRKHCVTQERMFRF